jgi:hypothetical protein
VPETFLRWALYLPIPPLAALLSFKTVTNQLMKEKEKDLMEGDGDKQDLLNIIRLFQFRFLFFSDENSCRSV